MAELFRAPAAHTELPLLIAFADLTRFAAESERRTDRDIAEAMDAFYALVCEVVVPAGGAVVKFIGDAAMVVFPEELADDGVRAMLDLKQRADAWLASIGWSSRLVVKAHFGTAIAGPFGPREYQRFDVIGSAANVAATLPSRGFSLSAPAFRKLSKASRTLFQKHTPPVVYIPTGSARP